MHDDLCYDAERSQSNKILFELMSSLSCSLLSSHGPIVRPGAKQRVGFRRLNLR